MNPNDGSEDVLRAVAGDRDALGRLLARHEARLRRAVARNLGAALGDRAHASDLLQSAFLQVVRGLERFEGTTEEEFSVWVVRVLENRIRHRHRYFVAQKRDAANAPPLPGRRSETPMGEVSRIEDLQRLAEALDTLPDDYRRVLLLRAADGLSYDQLAEVVGRTEGSVRMVLARARAALAAELERRGRDPRS